MPSSKNLVTTDVFTAVENKISHVGDLVKSKSFINGKKCFNTLDYNEFTNNVSDAKINKKGLLMNLIFQD